MVSVQCFYLVPTYHSPALADPQWSPKLVWRPSSWGIFLLVKLMLPSLFLDTIPDEDTAMSLAAPAVALANTLPVGHTAPLLPTPPSVLGTPAMVSQ